MILFLIVIAAIIVGFILYEKAHDRAEVFGLYMSFVGIIVFTILIIVSVINPDFPHCIWG